MELSILGRDVLLTSTARDLDGPVRQLSPIIAIQNDMYFLERKTNRGFLEIKTSSRNTEASFLLNSS
jgi:hypothetical protein